MKKIFSPLITAVGVILSIILLFAALASAFIYFTVYSPEVFTEGVASRIDNNAINTQIKDQIKLLTQTYGLDTDALASVVTEEELSDLTKKYFTDYYSAFISGGELPSTEYESPEFYSAISENAHLSKRPEVFEIEENKQALADKCNDAVKSHISSLSIKSAYNILSSKKDVYLRFAELGKYFPPIAAAFMIVFALLCFYIIRTKKHQTAYLTSLIYFAVSLIFSVPFAFVSALELPSKLNISMGSLVTYIDAVYKFIFAHMSHIYISISTGALILFVLTAIWNAYSVKSND